MAKLGINTGSSPNDGLGDSLLSAALKINNNFDEIYTTFGDGSSLQGYSNYAAVAGIATNSTNINISASNSSDVLTSVVLVADQTTGNQSPFIDGSLQYNANTGTLSANVFDGNLSGTADIANISVGVSTNIDINTTGIITANNGFISVGNTTPVTINVIGNLLIFNVVGIGSTSLILS